MLIQDYHVTFQSNAGRDLKAFREKCHKVSEIKMTSSEGEGKTKELYRAGTLNFQPPELLENKCLLSPPVRHSAMAV